MSWWQRAVIYQVYPRSFQDTNGDGVGDLEGIRRRLPYLKSLGVDALWLSPFYKSPMKDFGYDVADYRDVDPLFGKLSDADDLVSVSGLLPPLQPSLLLLPPLRTHMHTHTHIHTHTHTRLNSQEPAQKTRPPELARLWALAFCFF